MRYIILLVLLLTAVAVIERCVNERANRAGDYESPAVKCVSNGVVTIEREVFIASDSEDGCAAVDDVEFEEEVRHE